MFCNAQTLMTGVRSCVTGFYERKIAQVSRWLKGTQRKHYLDFSRLGPNNLCPDEMWNEENVKLHLLLPTTMGVQVGALCIPPFIENFATHLQIDVSTNILTQGKLNKNVICS